VIERSCEHVWGLIALEVVGQLSVDDEIALSAHTEGCPDCRDERRALMALSAVLPAADPDRFDGHELPFGLQTAVLDRLRAEQRRERRAHRSRYVLGSVAAAVTAAVVLTLVFAGSSGLKARTSTVALRGSSAVHATARLTPEPWGTELELNETGQPAGEVLSVAVRTTAGSWWQMGTYRTSGTPVRVIMACALKISAIRGVWVRDHAGRVVLRGYVDAT